MINKNLLTKALVVLTALFMMSAPVLAQDMCKGNFDFDEDVDGTDALLFKTHYGRSSYKNPCPPAGPAPVPKTGQTTTWTTGDDGDLQTGMPWPNPRFTDNEDGTVTDNLTGLIWLKNANCFGMAEPGTAFQYCDEISDGQCGLTDGSTPGDWRLPNKRELFSLVTDGYINPAVPDILGTGGWTDGDPFIDVQSSWYYSSTRSKAGAPYAFGLYVVDMDFGHISSALFSVFIPGQDFPYTWPVRGGH